MILQVLVLLAARPPAGTTISYDFRVVTTGPKGMTLEMKITERVDDIRLDGTLVASRLYSNVTLKSADTEAMKGVQSISGKRDRYTVDANGLWVRTSLNTHLGFPDFPYPEEAVAVGSTWATNGNLRGVIARLKEIRTYAGRRAAMVDFLPNPQANSKDQIGSGSYWVVDLADGRPLFARIEMTDPDLASTGAFTLVRQGIPGLDKEIAKL